MHTVQMFPAIARSHMAKKAQLLGIWLHAMLDTDKRNACFCLTNVSRLTSHCLQMVSKHTADAASA